MLRNRSLLAISLAAGVAMAGLGMVIPVRVLYAQSQGASLTIIGAMASSFLLANFLFQYPVGWLADLFGKRTIILAALFGQSILTILYLAVADPILFVALRFLEGALAAGVVSPARALVADLIPEGRRGEAYGIFGAFLNAGFLLGPAAGGFLAATGYRSAFVASCLSRILAAFLVILLVRSGRRRDAEERDRARAVPRRMLWTLPLLGVYILFFGDNLYFGFDLTLMPLWMRHHLGATVTMIGVCYAAWGLSNMLLSPVGGRIADRRRRSTLILLFGLAQVPFYTTYGFVTSVLVVLPLFVVHGAMYAMMQPAIDSHLAAFSPPEARARVQGVYNAIGVASAFITANLFSQLYGLNYRLPLFVMAAGFGVCVIIGGTLVRITEFRRPPIAAGEAGESGRAVAAN